jgi:FkbM family methyltransferase
MAANLEKQIGVLRESVVALKRTETMERAGLRWVLNPSDYVQRNLFWLGEHDRWDSYHIRHLLPSGAIVCDVGCNFGYYSLTLADSLKPNGRLFAFEPHPTTRARLERNIALNQLGDVITVVPYGLSDVPGTVRMTSRKNNTGASYICGDGPQLSQPLGSLSVCNGGKGNVKEIDTCFVRSGLRDGARRSSEGEC